MILKWVIIYYYGNYGVDRHISLMPRQAPKTCPESRCLALSLVATESGRGPNVFFCYGTMISPYISITEEGRGLGLELTWSQRAGLGPVFDRPGLAKLSVVFRVQ